jgi:hypothetical protein
MRPTAGLESHVNLEEVPGKADHNVCTYLDAVMAVSAF